MNLDGYPDPTAEIAISRAMKLEKIKRRKRMELESTIVWMTSPYYKERFKAEYFQLKIRFEKLQRMVSNWDNLKFEPTCKKETYITQLDAMRIYLTILEYRAEIEGIDLKNDL